MFSIRNTDTIEIKTRKGSPQSYFFVKNTTKLVNIYFVLLFCLLLHRFFQDQFALSIEVVKTLKIQVLLPFKLYCL